MPSNKAVWLPAKRAEFEIKSAPYTAPRENEIVDRNRAVAMNVTGADFRAFWLR